MRTIQHHVFVLLLLLSTLFCAAQTTNSAPGPASDVPKQVPSFDLKAMDKSVDPCVDFYQYACGNWMKNNPIPADKARWGRFNQLDEHNLYVLRDILEEAEAAKQPSAIQKKVGDFYASCMDEATIEKRSTQPLTPMMDQIAALKTKQDLIRQVGTLHRDGV